MGAALATALAAAALFAGLAGVAESGSTKAYAGRPPSPPPASYPR